MDNFDLIRYITNNSIIEGSPESTAQKRKTDGSLEQYGDYAKRSRKEISYHTLNGTEIPSITNAAVSGVVGASVNIQARTSSDKLNEQFEDLLDYHNTNDNFSTCGRFDRNEGFRLSEYFKDNQGGILMRHHTNSKWDIPYRVELISVNMIDTSKNIEHHNTLNGIVKDSYGRIAGIYIYDSYKKTTSTLVSMENMNYYSPIWMDLSQYTAVSELAKILPTLDRISQYTKATLEQAIEQSKAGFFWHTNLYNTVMDALSDEFKKTKTQDFDGKTAQAFELMKRLSAQGVKPYGGTAIPEGDTITTFDKKVENQYEIFTDQNERSMATAVGGSQISVGKDPEKSNYAGIKAIMSLDEEQFKIKFSRFQASIVNPYLKMLFRVGVQSNFLTVAKSAYFANPRKYHKWDVWRVSKESLDQEKTAKGNKVMLESGETTLSEVYAKKGKDYVTQYKKQKTIDLNLEKWEAEQREKMNLPISGEEDE